MAGGEGERRLKISAPARIDLSGGTLDVPPLCFLIKDSLTLNLAVDLRVSVSVGKTEPLETLFKVGLEYFDIQEPYRFKTETQIPRASGLGGSSSTLVALVHLLHRLAPDHGSFDPLNVVTVLEHRLLGKPAGTQDAIAAIYGGLNEIRFEHGSPSRQALALPPFLDGPLYLAYSKVQHHSGINNWEIIKAACEGDHQVLGNLERLNVNAWRMREALLNQDCSSFIESLYLEAYLRNRLSAHILTEPMAAFSKAIAGKVASKVCGAGGGGCMFLFGESMDPDYLRFEAARQDLEILTVMPDREGCVEVRV